MIARHGECVGDAMWASIWGKKIQHDRDIYAKIMDCFIVVLYRDTPTIHICHPDLKIIRSIRRGSWTIRKSRNMAHPTTFFICIPIPGTTVLTKPAKNSGFGVGFFGDSWNPYFDYLAIYFGFWVWNCGDGCGVGHFLVVEFCWVVCVYCLWWVSFDMERFLDGSIFGFVGICKAFGCIRCHALV